MPPCLFTDGAYLGRYLRYSGIYQLCSSVYVQYITDTLASDVSWPNGALSSSSLLGWRIQRQQFQREMSCTVLLQVVAVASSIMPECNGRTITTIQCQATPCHAMPRRESMTCLEVVRERSVRVMDDYLTFPPPRGLAPHAEATTLWRRRQRHVLSVCVPPRRTANVTSPRNANVRMAHPYVLYCTVLYGCGQ